MRYMTYGPPCPDDWNASPEEWDDLSDWQRYGWFKTGRITPHGGKEGRQWLDEFEAQLTPEDKLRRQKEIEAWVSARAEPIYRALDAFDEETS